MRRGTRTDDKLTEANGNYASLVAVFTMRSHTCFDMARNFVLSRSKLSARVPSYHISPSLSSWTSLAMYNLSVNALAAFSSAAIQSVFRIVGVI